MFALGVQRVRPKSSILVIEDSHPVGEILRCALEQEGCTAVLARSGPRGLDLARRLHPDLIALDVGHSCFGGADVIAELSADPATRDIPIVVLSARAADLEPALADRVARVFGEPFYPAEVVAAVLETLDDLRASTMVQPAARR